MAKKHAPPPDPPPAPAATSAPDPPVNDPPQKIGVLRNRVVERRKMLGSDLAPNPKNWRVHTQQQTEALNEILTTIGIAGELLAYKSERAGGKLVCINGHLRSGTWASELWDVAITDLSDAEADKLLAAMDPVGAAAKVDEEKLRALLLEIDAETVALQQILNDEAGIKEEAGKKKANPKIYVKLPIDIETGLDAYCQRQDVPPPADAVILVALKRFLIASGDMPAVQSSPPPAGS